LDIIGYNDDRFLLEFFMIKIEKFLVTQELEQLIAEIDQFKNSWQVLSYIAPEQLKSLRHIATIESVGSSTRIEGAKLSDREVESLLSGLDTHSFRSRDEEEVAGYAAVMEEVFASYDYIPLTENYIKQLHAILLKYSTKDVRHRGEYKKFPNHVEAFDAKGKSLGVVFATTSPFDTPREMQELVSWVQDTLDKKIFHPIIVIGAFIVWFLAIHPFQDGNGRLSRILTTLLLLKNGYTYVPYSSLETIVEENKEGYYLALRRTQGTLKTDSPDFQPWLMFFLRTLHKQKQRLEAKIKHEKLLQATLPQLSADILQLVEQKKRATIAEIIDATNASRSTVKKYLGMLVDQKYLRRHGKGRMTWYTRA